MTTLTKYSTVTAIGSGPRIEQIVNVVDNPRAAIDVVGFGQRSGTGGISGITRGDTGGPLPTAPTFARCTWSTSQTATTALANIRCGVPGKNLVTPGKTYVVSFYVRSSLAVKINPQIGAFNEGTYVDKASGTTKTLVPDTWTRFEVTHLAAANVTNFQIIAEQTPDSLLFAAGSTMDVSAVMVCVDDLPYADGDVEGWAWSGVRHASPSVGYGAIV